MSLHKIHRGCRVQLRKQATQDAYKPRIPSHFIALYSTRSSVYQATSYKVELCTIGDPMTPHCQPEIGVTFSVAIYYQH